MPSKRQWTYLPKVLQSRERWLVRILLSAIVLAVLFLTFNNYLFRIHTVPQVGGRYVEGMLGQPRFINPILAQTNDVDRDLVQLIYSGLFKYDGQGNLIQDLVESYSIEEEGLAYRIVLRKDVVWHDGEPFNADDVIFTIRTIQDVEYRSPLRTNWQSVGVEKIDDFTVLFKLNNVYAPFLHNLTLAILPRHLWSGISAQNFALAQYNLKPIGTGPYEFKEFSKDENGKVKSIELVRNEDYYLPTPASVYSDLTLPDETIQGPFIKSLAFKFYNNYDSLLEAYKKGQVNGISFIPAAQLAELEDDINIYEISLPAYYAIFFNQTDKTNVADKDIRQAIAHATDRIEIINRALKDKGYPVYSPIIPDWSEFATLGESYALDIEQAKSILEEEGWTDIDDDGIREKASSSEDDEELAIELITTDWPELRDIAYIIKEQWERVGIKTNLKIVNAAVVQQEYIIPREYEALLFGEVLSADPDPFAFWHSSQRKDPGLNLALYNNKEVDKLLEEARQTTDQEKRNELYLQFQEKINEDIPAIFLHSSVYLYPVSKSIKGISINRLTQHSYRFSQIESWYIKTKFSLK